MRTATSTETTGSVRPWHYFLVTGLLASTAGVLLAARSTPDNLILISLAILSAAGGGLAFHRMVWPLVSDEPDHILPVGTGRARAAIEREKTLVLRSIKELEFDRAMGKVSEQDFQELVARLRARAIGLMKQLEEPAPVYRDAIEQEVRRRLDARGGQREARAARPDREGRAAAEAARRCDACQTANDADARFCKQCGESLG